MISPKLRNSLIDGIHSLQVCIFYRSRAARLTAAAVNRFMRSKFAAATTSACYRLV
jgi:hypothetical protein